MDSIEDTNTTRMDEQTTSIMNRTELIEKSHPEIFHTSPRPGGFVRLQRQRNSREKIQNNASGRKRSNSVTLDTYSSSRAEKKRSSSTSRTAGRYGKRNILDDLNITRSYRIQRALDDMKEDEDEEEEEGEEKDKSTKEGPASKAIDENILMEQANRVVVKIFQTVLLLAGGYTEINDDLIISSYLFLKNLENRNGEIPPNSHKLLNHLRYIGAEELLLKYDMDANGRAITEEEKSIILNKTSKSNASRQVSEKSEAEESAAEPPTEPSSEPPTETTKGRK